MLSKGMPQTSSPLYGKTAAWIFPGGAISLRDSIPTLVKVLSREGMSVPFTPRRFPHPYPLGTELQHHDLNPTRAIILSFDCNRQTKTQDVSDSDVCVDTIILDFKQWRD